MSTALTGQITITTPGTAIQGPSTPAGNMWQLTAHTSNAGAVYVGDDGTGDVASTTGYGLKPGDKPLIVQANNLSAFWFDAAVSNDKVVWLRLS